MGKVFDWKRRKGNVMGSVFMFPEFGGLGLKEKVLCGMAFVAFFLFGVINGDAVYWNNSKVTAIALARPEVPRPDVGTLPHGRCCRRRSLRRRRLPDQGVLWTRAPIALQVPRE